MLSGKKASLLVSLLVSRCLASAHLQGLHAPSGVRIPNDQVTPQASPGGQTCRALTSAKCGTENRASFYRLFR